MRRVIMAWYFWAVTNLQAEHQQGQSRQVIANGVTIDSGAQFNFVAVANKTLTAGKVFAVISNTSANPIAGTFANLPEGSTFTVGHNTFQASYEGDDGNDLTLTVLPSYESAWLSKGFIDMIAAMKSPIVSCAMIFAFLLSALDAIYANSATWNLQPTSGDWNTAINWTPATVPNGLEPVLTLLQLAQPTPTPVSPSADQGS
ncbi:MAG: hypothetical protein DMF00_15655 [Verrucomicrobia bacterium]|nr:MAG: hypothetical protein DMF00_15655 [Verrucomicrobiota bacterium]